MKPYKVTFLAVLLALLPCLELQAASTRTRIDRLMSAYHACGQLNGVILVKQGDDVIYERAFGLANREWNVANTPDSKFLIGSVSKSTTALMVLILANEGLIDLNGRKKTLISHGGSTDGYKAYSTRIVEDRTDIIIVENDYFRTDVGVKWTYDLTNDIIDVLAGKEVPQPKKSIAKALGLTIGRAGVDKALAQLAVLKKDPAYQISARDYYLLGSELDGKNGLKAASIRIFEAGLADYPDDFRLTYYLAQTLTGSDDTRALELYKKCIRLYDGNETNKRFSEEYKKAMAAVNGPKSGAGE